MPPLSRAAAFLLAVAAASPAYALEVVSVDPPAESLTAGVTTPIRITFDVPVDLATVSKATVRAFGRWSGPADGDRTLSVDGLTLTLTPTLPFSAGELVHVNLSNGLGGTDQSTLRAAGYAYRFHTRAGRAGPQFEETHRASVRDPEPPSAPVRLYGGLACDLDRDGYLDLSIVNEGSADMRILQNLDDGSATFAPFLRPPTPIGAGASPSEAGDFDQDGAIDVCTANHEDQGGSVTVVFGDGAGGFLPTLRLGGVPDPRGMVILDVDGDGDRDIVVTGATSSQLALIRNNGDRTFEAPEVFEGGGSGEWGLSTADMNEDGVLDLVVGFRYGHQANVLLGNGDGTFTAQGDPVDLGGSPWMADTGDVNGDGHVDVVLSMNTPGGGALLLGDGTGALGAPVLHSQFGHTPATDFGDLDGDGDLDWVLSGFSARTWRVLENDGSGGFTRRLDVRATSNPGCAVVFDADKDGDLDLALLDEVNDEVIVMQNGPTHVRAALVPSHARLVLGGAGARITPRLTARGSVHWGAPASELPTDMTVVVGTRSYDVSLVRERRRGLRRVFVGDGARLRLDAAAADRSRDSFVLTVRDDLTSAITDTADVLLSLESGLVSTTARLDLDTGRFRLARGGLLEPALTVSHLRATLLGDGADRCSLGLLIPGTDPPPTEAPALAVTLGDFTATLPSDAFVLRRGAFRLRAPTDDVRRAVYAPTSGRITIVARDVDLGPYEDGPLTITLDTGAGPMLVTFTPSLRGRRLLY